MSWGLRIIAPAEAAPVLADPSAYVPQTALGPFRTVLDWITTRADRWNRRDVDTVTVTTGKDSYVVLHLATVRWHEMISEAHRQRELRGDTDGSFTHEFMSAYVPDDDEGVIEITVDGRGSGGDAGLLEELAEWLQATIFECQFGEMMTPQEWRRRCLQMKE
jgi:hypothetical protein